MLFHKGLEDAFEEHEYTVDEYEENLEDDFGPEMPPEPVFLALYSIVINYYLFLVSLIFCFKTLYLFFPFN